MHTPTTATELLANLGAAAAGLLFPSESDYPLTPYRWVGTDGAEPSPAALIQAEGRKADTPVETLGPRELFEPLFALQADATDEEKAEVARYRALVDLLKGTLSALRVYRVGEVDIDVYVLGRHASGEWLGLKTRVVET